MKFGRFWTQSFPVWLIPLFIMFSGTIFPAYFALVILPLWLVLLSPSNIGSVCTNYVWILWTHYSSKNFVVCFIIWFVFRQKLQTWYRSYKTGVYFCNKLKRYISISAFASKLFLFISASGHFPVNSVKVY